MSLVLLGNQRVGILMHKIYLEQSLTCISELFDYNLDINSHITRHRMQKAYAFTKR